MPKTMVFTRDEIIGALVLCADLEPEKYPKPAARAVIEKCNALRSSVDESGPVYVSVQGD